MQFPFDMNYIRVIKKVYSAIKADNEVDYKS